MTNELSKGKKITERILREIDGCSVLCKNCHKVLHTETVRFDSLKDEIYKKMLDTKELPSSYLDRIKEYRDKGYRQYEVVRELGCAKSTVNRVWKM